MKLGRIAFIAGSVFLAGWLALNLIESQKKQRRLLSHFMISVVRIGKTMPPGLVVEVKNIDVKPITRIHVRLVFESGDKEFSRVDSDFASLGANETRRIILESRFVDSAIVPVPGSRVRFYLQAFPEYGEGTSPIEGEFISE